MPLRAVIFDYGMVLSGQPKADKFDEIIDFIGLSREQFLALYEKQRNLYDQGMITGQEYWKKICEEAGRSFSEEQIKHLVHLDAEFWTVCDPAMVAWQKQLKAQGYKTAILSNMCEVVLESLSSAFDWIENFDLKVWSYKLHLIKPDPAIYRYTLENLGVAAEEALFIDDRVENVETAISLGLNAIVYTDRENLRSQLESLKLDAHFPLPA